MKTTTEDEADDTADDRLLAKINARNVKYE